MKKCGCRTCDFHRKEITKFLKEQTKKHKALRKDYEVARKSHWKKMNELMRAL